MRFDRFDGWKVMDALVVALLLIWGVLVVMWWFGGRVI